jgi:beta-glucosidase
MITTTTPYPAGFLWGVATAAHQIEGNNVSSDYWLLENLQPTNFVEPSGDACDSWNRWPEDVALVAGLGCNAYRFSVEWARIEPEEGAFSQAALQHYRRQCIALREAGVTPVVTLHHFTSPRWLAARGGWADAGTPARFARYAEQVGRALGDLVGAFCTLNEPNAQVNSYILRGEKPFDGEDAVVRAACHALGSDRFGSYFMGDSYRVRDVCLQAHAAGVQALGAVAPGVPSGLTLALQAWECGEGGEALYRRLFDNARQPFYAAAAGDAFVGVQAYIRLRTGPAGFLPTDVPAALRDRSGHDASPEVLEIAVREAHHCCGAPVYVTEHGLNSDDDLQRQRHLAASLPGLQRCMADGIPVLGYTHWSLLDNFEWRSGYAPKFGLYAVDRHSFERRAKPSAAVFASMLRAARGGAST